MVRGKRRMVNRPERITRTDPIQPKDPDCSARRREIGIYHVRGREREFG
jgi:hypothetical protein